MRLSAALAVGVGAMGISFGVLAVAAGLSPATAIVLSAATYAGAAQFAAIAVLTSGGTIAAAAGAFALMNARYVTIGVALARALPGPPLRRALQAQALNDTAVVLSRRDDGSHDRWIMFGAGFIQYVTWVAGTVVGAVGGAVLGDTEELGIDAIAPAFFFVVLIGELRDRRSGAMAVTATAVALALVPLTPAGVPLLAASLLAIAAGWLARDREAAT
jgi:4-azaleucine resistance transporter AzlC